MESITLTVELMPRRRIVPDLIQQLLTGFTLRSKLPLTGLQASFAVVHHPSIIALAERIRFRHVAAIQTVRIVSNVLLA